MQSRAIDIWPVPIQLSFALRIQLGRVTAFSMSGIDMWFNSHDHGPPHFHARRPGIWEVRIYFSTGAENLADYDLKWGRRPGRRELRELLAMAVEHRTDLLEEWEAKVKQ